MVEAERRDLAEAQQKNERPARGSRGGRSAGPAAVQQAQREQQRREVQRRVPRGRGVLVAGVIPRHQRRQDELQERAGLVFERDVAVDARGGRQRAGGSFLEVRGIVVEREAGVAVIQFYFLDVVDIPREQPAGSELPVGHANPMPGIPILTHQGGDARPRLRRELELVQPEVNGGVQREAQTEEQAGKRKTRTRRHDAG